MINKHNQKAFTIIELILIISIIGVLSGIAVMSYSDWNKKLAISQVKSDLNGAISAMEDSRNFGDSYPASIPTTFQATNGITLSGGSFDGGATYCVSAASQKYTDVIYRVTSDNTTPRLGGCDSGTFVAASGGPASENGRSLVQLNDGSFIVVGETRSYGGGSVDMVISKYDSKGQLLWFKTIGGAGNDIAYKVIKTSDSKFTLLGTTDSYGSGDSDVVLIKFDSSGNIIWNKIWGNSGANSGYDFIQASDGSYVVTGSTYVPASGADLFIAKFSSDGTPIWNKTWSTNYADEGFGIIQTSDGGFAIEGSTYYQVGQTDIILVKYTSDGTLSWSKVWGSAGYDTARNLVQLSDSSFILSGETDLNDSNGDMFIAKFSSNGDFQWNRTWGKSNSHDGGRYIVKLTNDNFAIVGRTGFMAVGGYGSVFITKFDANGNLIFNRTWGEIDFDDAYSVIPTSDGGLAVSGITYTPGGNNDLLILKATGAAVVNNCGVNACLNPTATISNTSATTSSISPATSSFTAAITNTTLTAVNQTTTNNIIIPAPN